MKKIPEGAWFAIGFVVIGYIVLAYVIAMTNVAEMNCPKGQQVVQNPFTLGATGKCEK